MRFLGPSSAVALARMAESLAPAAAACPAANVPVTGLGTFPPHGAPRILWIGLDLPAPMLALQSACERAARAAGFEHEARSFRPHVTLGRWRDRGKRPRLPEMEPASTHIERLVLFRSELKPSGAVHVPLFVFPLGAAAILPPTP